MLVDRKVGRAYKTVGDEQFEGGGGSESCEGRGLWDVVRESEGVAGLGEARAVRTGGGVT